MISIYSGLSVTNTKCFYAAVRLKARTWNLFSRLRVTVRFYGVDAIEAELDK